LPEAQIGGKVKGAFAVAWKQQAKRYRLAYRHYKKAWINEASFNHIWLCADEKLGEQIRSEYQRLNRIERLVKDVELVGQDRISEGLKNELRKKCDVVCANCHADRTYKQGRKAQKVGKIQ
jgi:hypothetical protein